MRKLCLFRHAKSSWKYPKLDDFERPLNKRGRKNAPFMGNILHRMEFCPDIIISSPASRAAMTARMLALKIDYSPDKIEYLASIYEASENNLLHTLMNLNDNMNTIMLVGHNPSLTLLANQLGNYPIANIPTCGACCLSFSMPSWSQIKNNTGEFIFFEFPKKYP